MSTAYTRKPRGERYALTVGTAEDLGLDDDGGKWVVCCDEHSTVVNVDTRRVALEIKSWEFCDECRDEEFPNTLT